MITLFIHADPFQYPYTRMEVSKENSSPSFAISADKMTVSNPKGYSIARGSFGIREGTLFFEVDILERGPCPFESQTEPHIRLGVAMSQAEAEAPIGYDYFGFCYRDLDGSTFYQSRRKDYGKPFHEGDTVGVLLELPPIPPETPEVLVKVLTIPGSKATGRKPPTPLPLHPGSKLSFFVNGEPQGVAYSDFHCGTYYPAVSSYMGGQARFNFGPDFKYPPNMENVKSAYEVGIELGRVVSERLEREKAEAEQKKAGEAHTQHEKRHKRAGGADVTPVRTPSPVPSSLGNNVNGASGTQNAQHQMRSLSIPLVHPPHIPHSQGHPPSQQNQFRIQLQPPQSYSSASSASPPPPSLSSSSLSSSTQSEAGSSSPRFKIPLKKTE